MKVTADNIGQVLHEVDDKARSMPTDRFYDWAKTEFNMTLARYPGSKANRIRLLKESLERIAVIEGQTRFGIDKAAGERTFQSIDQAIDYLVGVESDVSRVEGLNTTSGERKARAGDVWMESTWDQNTGGTGKHFDWRLGKDDGPWYTGTVSSSRGLKTALQNAVKRLPKYRSKQFEPRTPVVGIDCHMTLMDAHGPSSDGPVMDGAKEELQKLVDAGVELGIWSVGSTEPLREWAERNDLPITWVNESPLTPDDTTSGKERFDVYVDDKNVVFDPEAGWDGMADKIIALLRRQGKLKTIAEARRPDVVWLVSKASGDREVVLRNAKGYLVNFNETFGIVSYGPKSQALKMFLRDAPDTIAKLNRFGGPDGSKVWAELIDGQKALDDEDDEDKSSWATSIRQAILDVLADGPKTEAEIKDRLPGASADAIAQALARMRADNKVTNVGGKWAVVKGKASPGDLSLGDLVLVTGPRFNGKVGKVVRLYNSDTIAVVSGNFGHASYRGREERDFMVSHLEKIDKVDKMQNERIWLEGYRAGLRGRPKNSCPHSGGSDKKDWLEGWQDAKSGTYEGGREVEDQNQQRQRSQKSLDVNDPDFTTIKAELTKALEGVEEKGIADAAARFIANKWQWAVDRYGRKGAIAFVAALLITMPIPFNTAIVPAIAEGLRLLIGSGAPTAAELGQVAPTKSKAITVDEADGSAPVVQALRAAGEELAHSKDPAPMPGYGQIFYQEGHAWYVGGDGDEDGFADLVKEKLGAIDGVDEVTVEAETFPKDRERWLQVYPVKETKDLGPVLTTVWEHLTSNRPERNWPWERQETDPGKERLEQFLEEQRRRRETEHAH